MKWIAAILFFCACNTIKPTTGNLDASKSYDPDGWIVKYYWRQISGPGAMKGKPSEILPAVILKKKGIYQFELTVTDNHGATGKDTLTINNK